MVHRTGRRNRRSFALGSRQGSRVCLGFVGAMVLLVACAPAAGSTAGSSAPEPELEVRIATNCDAGAEVVIEVDDATYTFEDLELTGQAHADLPFSGTARVPWRQGGPYRVTLLVGCDDARVKEIATYRVVGDVRTLVGTTTTTGRGVATSEGGL